MTSAYYSFENVFLRYFFHWIVVMARKVTQNRIWLGIFESNGLGQIAVGARKNAVSFEVEIFFPQQNNWVRIWVSFKSN